MILIGGEGLGGCRERIDAVGIHIRILLIQYPRGQTPLSPCHRDVIYVFAFKTVQLEHLTNGLSRKTALAFYTG